MKAQIGRRLKSSKIVIYGNDSGSERFIKELVPFFSDMVHMTDFTEELELQPFAQYGIETVWFDDYEVGSNTYVVITGQFIRSQNKLRLLQLEEYIDYASIYVVRAIIQQKKLVITMGNSAMSQLTAALKVCSGFSDQYTVKYYNNNNFYRGDIRKYQEYQHVAKVSDVYIYSIRSEVGYEANLIKKDQMRTPCIRIGISGNDFNGFYPQLDRNSYLSKYCFREYKMRDIPYKYYAFSPQDRIMESFIEKKLSREDIIAAFRDPELLDIAQIEKNFEDAIAHIRESDELADIPLAEEIIRLKSQIIVSRSLEEWHPQIIAYMLEGVFQRIGHKESKYCYDDLAEASCEWSGNEIPIYPCVLKYFGLEETTVRKKYKIVSYENIRYMDLNEYAEYFADYCIKAGALCHLMYFKGDRMITNVLDYLEQSAYQYGSEIAFSDDREFIRYYQLRSNARNIGSYIAKNFSAVKQPIAVLMKKSVHSVIGFFGIVYSGNFYCPIDEDMPMERMKKILDILRPKLILADQENIEMAKAFGIPVISYVEAIKEEDNVRELDRIKASMLDTDPLYVLFTSGSTGFPKGVLISHRAIIDSTEWIGSTLHITERDVIGNQSPFYFDNSTFDIYTGIKHGCTIHIIPKELFSFPIQLLNYINAKKITTICWVPSALCLVANVRALATWESRNLKNVFFCGEVMPSKQLNMWRQALPDAVFVNLYGMTEITMSCSYYVVDRDFKDDESLPIGRTCKNMEILVLNENNQLVEGNETGEICVRGCGLSYGYYGNSEQTEKAFIQNPVNTQYPEKIYRTGDLGRYNERGELMYAGRKDYQIKHKGHRIELGEIETAAGKISGISMSACIYDNKKSRIVMFYSGVQLSAKMIKEQLGEYLPKYMVPDKMIWQERLPHNPNGKISRKQLKENYDYGVYKQS